MDTLFLKSLFSTQEENMNFHLAFPFDCMVMKRVGASLTGRDTEMYRTGWE
jgi:hypothetical protein